MVTALCQVAGDRKLIEALGAAGIRTTELRYGLTSMGRDWAADAARACCA